MFSSMLSHNNITHSLAISDQSHERAELQILINGISIQAHPALAVHSRHLFARTYITYVLHCAWTNWSRMIKISSLLFFNLTRQHIHGVYIHSTVHHQAYMHRIIQNYAMLVLASNASFQSRALNTYLLYTLLLYPVLLSCSSLLAYRRTPSFLDSRKTSFILLYFSRVHRPSTWLKGQTKN